MTDSAAPSVSNLSHALNYAASGLYVFPVHTAVGVRCSCARPRCTAPGKHPRTPRGLKDASIDPAEITNWWTAFPASNIGIRTGSSLIVIDIDPARGGDDALSALQAANSLLPPTVESVTGGGGRHLFFSHPAELRNSVDTLSRGVDIRGDGGYVVAPPSVHASGRQYEWASGRAPGSLPLAPLPAWVVTLATRVRNPGAPNPIADHVIEGGRNEFLFKQACGLRGKGYPEETILTSMLSLNASVCRPPLDEVEVRQVVTKVVRNYQPGVYTGQVGSDGGSDPAGRILPGGVPGQPIPVEWEQELTFDKYHRIKGDTPGNAALLLGNLPEWQGCLQFDEFANRINWIRTPPLVAGLAVPAIGELRDSDFLYVQQWLAKNRQVTFSKGSIQDAIISAAFKNTINPLRAYVSGLVWDGTPRVTRWLTTYLGAHDSEYTRAVGMWWLVSAVARAIQPGCQCDHTLILEGPQGAGKSSAVRILAGDWYLGSLPDLRDTARAADALNGHWVVEMGELDALRGSGLTRVKDFATQTQDTYRAAYARFKRTYQRSCAFVGTTNESKYLHDPTGARRWWPVKVVRLARKKLTEDRDQLWAEAKFMYENGQQWHPTEELLPLLRAEQEARYDVDPWEDVVSSWVEEFEEGQADAEYPTPLTTAHVLSRCLEVKVGLAGRAESNRIAGIMRRLGYEMAAKRFKKEPIPGLTDEAKSAVTKVWTRVTPQSAMETSA